MFNTIKIKILGVLLIITNCAYAFPQIHTVLSIDTVKYNHGILPNGLNYYLINNEKPRGRANFTLITKVGACNELPNEIGAAHFIEHLAFEESKNIPYQGIKKYAKYLGINDYNYNGKTTLLHTTLSLKDIPISNNCNIDTCLFILKEWSSNITFNPQTVELTKGVICSEIANHYISENSLKQEAYNDLFAGSKYYNKNVLGNIEAIQQLSPETLSNFYQKWYKPTSQAIIISGNIDKKKIEKKIRDLWSDMSKEATNNERDLFEVFHDKNRQKTILKSSPFAKSTFFKVCYILDTICTDYRNSREYYELKYKTGIICSLLKQRIAHKLNETDLREVKLHVSFNRRLGEMFNNPSFEIVFENNGTMWKKQLKCIFQEIQQISANGFSEEEFEKEKELFTKWISDLCTNIDSKTNSEYENICIEHFILNEDMTSLKDLYPIMITFLQGLKLEDINLLFRSITNCKNEHIIATIHSNSADGVPTPKDLRKLIDSYKKITYSNNLIKKCNLTNQFDCDINNSQIYIKNKETDSLNATVITLSNNVKIVVKKISGTNSIHTKGFILGGISCLPDSIHLVRRYIENDFPNAIGYNGMSSKDIYSLYHQQQIVNNIYITGKESVISGECHINSFENYLKSLYLSLTTINTNEDVLSKYITKTNDLFLTERNKIEKIEESAYASIFKNTFPKKTPTPKNLLQAYKTITSNFNGLVLVITGNTDIANLDSLLVKYLGSLPSDKVPTHHAPRIMKEKWNTVDTIISRLNTGNIILANSYYHIDSIAFTPKNYFLTEVTEKVIQSLLEETLRHKLGLVYNVKCRCSLIRNPKPRIIMNITYPTTPKYALKISNTINSLFFDIEKINIDNKIIEQYKSSLEIGLPYWEQQTTWWLNRIYRFYHWGIDVDANMLKESKSITELDIKKYIQNLSKKGNKIRISLTGKQ